MVQHIATELDYVYTGVSDVVPKAMARPAERERDRGGPYELKRLDGATWCLNLSGSCAG